MSRIALIFPGQGAQAVGMGQALAAAAPEARALFERASEVLGYDLGRLCWEGPLDQLTRSEHAQPALFVVSAAVLEGLRRNLPALSVNCLAGLSSGEWTALYAAGVLGFDETLRVLQARGRFMQEACEAQPGSMTSVIGLDVERVRAVAQAAGAEVANLNSDEQTVLSGRPEAIEEAERLAGEAGAKKVIRLNVAGAFHSSLMEPAARKLEACLADLELAPPRIPVLSNVTGAEHGDPSDIRRRMIEQVTGSVRWTDCVRRMRARGVSVFIECGHGRVLSGLIKRIDKEAELLTISAPDAMAEVVSRLSQV